MAPALVRHHTPGTANTPGTTIAATLAANVAADGLLVAWVFFYSDSTTTPVVTGISKPGGETATWARVAQVNAWTSDAGGGFRGELWVIKTTATWTSATAVTATITSSPNDYRIIQLSEYSGAGSTLRGAAGVVAVNSGTPDPSIAGALAGDLVVGCGAFNGNPVTADTDTTNGSWSSAHTVTPSLAGIVQYKVVTASGTQTYNPTGPAHSIALVAAFATNVAPNAPTLTAPGTGTTIDRNVTQRMDWTVSDPDPGDSQSKFDLRYRLGAGAWVTVSQTTPNSFWDAAPATFAAGSYEWQVRTYDQGDPALVGPYSASSFFTSADSPGVPSITAPTNGSTVNTTATLTWSVTTQTHYQVRRVGDLAGAADTGTVYYDSGEITSTGTRTLGLTFTVNARWEHIQVRVKAAGLWSSWADCRVFVSWTAPMVPVVTCTPNSATASIEVTVTNPAVTGGAPVTAYNDVYVSSALDLEYRAATLLAPNSTWTWRTPAADRAYTVTARAVGTNGTTATST